MEYLVFETGGTKLVAGVAGGDCRIIETSIALREPGDRAEKSFQRLLEAGRSLKRQYELRGHSLRAIGFGFGGIVRRSTRDPFLCLHEEGWENLQVVETLEKEFGRPVFVENDCKLAALAEAHFGAGKDHQTVFYMTIGTGVGGGIVKDGRIQAMSDVGEAEIGHIVVMPGGPPCWCGGRGCVEAVCSGPGMTQLAVWMARQDAPAWGQSALGATMDSAGQASSKDLLDAWKSGDSFAQAVVETSAEYLATAVAAAINLISPEVFVIGGGVGTGNERYLALVSEKARGRIVTYFRNHCQIVPCALREQVVTQGAAILAAQLSGHPVE